MALIEKYESNYPAEESLSLGMQVAAAAER